MHPCNFQNLRHIFETFDTLESRWRSWSGSRTIYKSSKRPKAQEPNAAQAVDSSPEPPRLREPIHASMHNLKTFEHILKDFATFGKNRQTCTYPTEAEIVHFERENTKEIEYVLSRV